MRTVGGPELGVRRDRRQHHADLVVDANTPEEFTVTVGRRS
jgi:hypothetical protein